MILVDASHNTSLFQSKIMLEKTDQILPIYLMAYDYIKKNPTCQCVLEFMLVESVSNEMMLFLLLCHMQLSCSCCSTIAGWCKNNSQIKNRKNSEILNLIK